MTRTSVLEDIAHVRPPVVVAAKTDPERGVCPECKRCGIMKQKTKTTVRWTCTSCKATGTTERTRI